MIMLKRKKEVAIILSVVCLSFASISTHVMAMENKPNATNNSKASVGLTEFMTKDSMILESDKEETYQYSMDGGGTWVIGDENSKLDTPLAKWTPVTEADLLREIEEVKANLADKQFMSNWAAMGKTEQELLNYISRLEQDIQDLKTEKVTEFGAVDNGDGTSDRMTFRIDNSMVSEQKNSSVIIFSSQTGAEVYYEAPTDEELYSVIKAAYENGEITEQEKEEALSAIK